MNSQAEPYELSTTQAAIEFVSEHPTGSSTSQNNSYRLSVKGSNKPTEVMNELQLTFFQTIHQTAKVKK